jgi:transcriptional regulator with XRE-family HTH domain
MSSAELFINGELLRLGRETRGWSLNDMATRSCMSVKQIHQLEEGGMSCFYSEAVKLTAAKKVGVLLGVSLDDLFAREPEPTPEPESIPEDADTQDKPVADVEVTVSVDTAPESVIDQLDAVVHAVVPENPSEPKTKTSLWVIVALFAAALAVAAYMQPKEEPVAEPAPPLLVVPSESDAPASAAEGVASSASAGVEPVVAPVVNIPASLPRVVVRPASAAATAPAAAAASVASATKAP